MAELMLNLRPHFDLIFHEDGTVGGVDGFVDCPPLPLVFEGEGYAIFCIQPAALCPGLREDFAQFAGQDWVEEHGQRVAIVYGEPERDPQTRAATCKALRLYAGQCLDLGWRVRGFVDGRSAPSDQVFVGEDGLGWMALGHGVPFGLILIPPECGGPASFPTPHKEAA